MKRVLKSGNPTEDVEQMSLVDWIDRCTPFCPELENFTAIPNGGARMSKTAGGRRYSPEAAKLKAMGVRKGYPDVLLDVPSLGIGDVALHGLRIEMKSLDASASISPEQHSWIAKLRFRRYAAHVCHGWVSAAWRIADYLEPVVDGTVYRRLIGLIPRA